MSVTTTTMQMQTQWENHLLTQTRFPDFAAPNSPDCPASTAVALPGYTDLQLPTEGSCRGRGTGAASAGSIMARRRQCSWTMLTGVVRH